MLSLVSIRSEENLNSPTVVSVPSSKVTLEIFARTESLISLSEFFSVYFRFIEVIPASFNVISSSEVEIPSLFLSCQIRSLLYISS